MFEIGNERGTAKGARKTVETIGCRVNKEKYVLYVDVSGCGGETSVIITYMKMLKAACKTALWILAGGSRGDPA